MTDPVNAPAHYQSPNGVECIEAIKAAMTPEEFFGYLRGNCIKYIWRYRKKIRGQLSPRRRFWVFRVFGHLNNSADPSEDLRKAKWYLSRLILEFETNPYDDPLR
jgi:hypothetical protein